MRTHLSEQLQRPVRAVAVDIFRILSGALVCAYFVRLLLEFSAYTSENGLLDHELHQELFWFTRMTLFYPGSPPLYKLTLLALGLFGAVMLTVGWRPRLGAAVAWVLAVSAQRWNFAVINLDDSSVTLLLWWMLFLPIGHSLTWKTLGRRNLREEAGLTVNGFFVRAFFVNLFLYYLTAGLTKLWSPLWREGLALYVILQLPIARTQGIWQVEHLPALWWGNHATLLLEPLFPFLVLLPKGHPLKWFGGGVLLVFHLSIPITIGVPYANLALIMALALIFHAEIADLFDKRLKPGPTRLVSTSAPAKNAKRLISAYLIVLALAMSKGVPIVEKSYEPAMAALYWAGVAQEYHLFDWVDHFNWHVQHQVTVHPKGAALFRVPSTQVFPASVRGFIYQSYLLPVRWMRISTPLTGEMRNSVLHRAAHRFVREQSQVLGKEGRVVITSRMGRLQRDNLMLEQTWGVNLLEFEYRDGKVSEFLYPRPPSEGGWKSD